MGCDVVDFNGDKVIVCARSEVARCKVCGGFAPFLCDYEVEPGRTCDAPLCGRCRINKGVKDFCPEHAGKHA